MSGEKSKMDVVRVFFDKVGRGVCGRKMNDELVTMTEDLFVKCGDLQLVWRDVLESLAAQKPVQKELNIISTEMGFETGEIKQLEKRLVLQYFMLTSSFFHKLLQNDCGFAWSRSSGR